MHADKEVGPHRSRSDNRLFQQSLLAINPRAKPYDRPVSKAPEGQWGHDAFIEAHPYARKQAEAERKSKVADDAIHRFLAPKVKDQSKYAPNNFNKSNARSTPVIQVKDKKAEVKLAEERNRRVKKAKNDWEIEHRRALKEGDGFVIRVQGLVTGTTAEDVQAAFASYGSILLSYISSQQLNGSLEARIVFERKKEAQSACDALDGAIADGESLSVKLVAAKPTPAPFDQNAFLADLMQNEPKFQPTTTAPPVSTRMHADEIEAKDPYFSGTQVIQNDNDMEIDSPANNRGKNRRGRGNGQIPTGPRSSDLFSRLNVPAAQKTQRVPNLLERIK